MWQRAASCAVQVPLAHAVLQEAECALPRDHVTLQGQLEVTTKAGTGAAADSNEDVVQNVPYLMLALDLPPARLFQDAMEANIIPQARRQRICVLCTGILHACCIARAASELPAAQWLLFTPVPV
jgi:hypothetical protein